MAMVPVVLPRMSFSAAEEGPMMCSVTTGEFLHEVTEQGNVESASNVEIRCEVKSESSAGTQILRIVDEGTYVQPGDFLVEFDSSARQKELIQQQIACHNSEAEVIKAKMTLATAELAKREYENGTYVQEELTLKGALAVAKDNERRSIEFLAYSQALVDRGYIPETRLIADRFGVEKAESDRKAAEKALEVLQKYTQVKVLGQLQSDIDTAKATLAAKEASDQLEQTKLQDIETQIARCTVTAPSAGQVVYANVTDHRGNNQIIIEPGTQIREMQVVIRLPDPAKMQVVAKINESKISYVRKGMPARVRVEAIGDEELPGIVEKVNEYPAPSGWFTSNIKEYETTIRILANPPGLRPGLTAEVRIRSEHLHDAKLVPVQAVFEHGKGQYYCVMPEGDQFVAHQLQIGPSNNEFVVIRDGLEPAQQIVLHANAYRDKVNLPELPPELAGMGEHGSMAEGGGERPPGPRDAAPRAERDDQMASAEGAPRQAPRGPGDGQRSGPPEGAPRGPGGGPPSGGPTGPPQGAAPPSGGARP